MNIPDRPGMLRLFYALWPDEATRSALAGLVPPGAGKPTPPAHLHLTLAFLGNQPAARLPELCALLQTLSFAPLDLRIDHYGYFARPRILWAGMQPCPALMALQRDLMQQLARLGLQAGSQPTLRFRPHVTLMRKASGMPTGADNQTVQHDRTAAFSPIDWRADTIALVVSTITPAESLYDVLAQRQAAAG
jgi:2'-5' RNA ligase